MAPAAIPRQFKYICVQSMLYRFRNLVDHLHDFEKYLKQNTKVFAHQISFFEHMLFHPLNEEEFIFGSGLVLSAGAFLSQIVKCLEPVPYLLMFVAEFTCVALYVSPLPLMIVTTIISYKSCCLQICLLNFKMIEIQLIN